MSLATKYRPKTLDEIISQGSIVKILKRQIETGQIKNAYVFSGASGCGKTTAARAFASASSIPKAPSIVFCVAVIA